METTLEAWGQKLARAYNLYRCAFERSLEDGAFAANRGVIVQMHTELYGQGHPFADVCDCAEVFRLARDRSPLIPLDSAEFARIFADYHMAKSPALAMATLCSAGAPTDRARATARELQTEARARTGREQLSRDLASIFCEAPRNSIEWQIVSQAICQGDTDVIRRALLASGMGDTKAARAARLISSLAEQLSP